MFLTKYAQHNFVRLVETFSVVVSDFASRVVADGKLIFHVSDTEGRSSCRTHFSRLPQISELFRPLQIHPCALHSAAARTFELIMPCSLLIDTRSCSSCSRSPLQWSALFYQRQPRPAPKVEASQMSPSERHWGGEGNPVALTLRLMPSESVVLHKSRPEDPAYWILAPS